MRLRRRPAAALLAAISAAVDPAQACTCTPNQNSPEIFVARIVSITALDGISPVKVSAENLSSPRLMRYEAIKVLRGSTRTTGTLRHDPSPLFCGAPTNLGHTYIFYLRVRTDSDAPACSFEYVDPAEIDGLGKR